ncbi:DapH/DapD/GlmU-related protein [Amphibacillus jilinensis]|uniref:DapH/DapD/GlmU-related protein n=1 Tax=Amphibacillus jilinensis TaxID=1216008 RepID=UPI0002E6D904|nr:DapH/DapD/GlmU-related protein [Amphibacillus jilinensis]
MKAFLLCNDRQDKMFPFDKHYQVNSLPLLNKEMIFWQIEQLLESGISESDIYVFLNYKADQTRRLLKKYKNIQQIESSISLDSFLRTNNETFEEGVIIQKGNYLITSNDITSLMASEAASSVLLTHKKQESIDMIGAQVENNQVVKFLAHARDHYVTAEVSGAYKLDKRALDSIAYANYGFNHRVTGSMIPNRLFLENGLNDYLEEGNRIQAIFAQDKVHHLQFPWDILHVNSDYLEKYAEELQETTIGDHSFISEEATINGHVTLGEHSFIGKNVTINGNVIVGNNVKIDTGAIINGPVLIGDHSYVKDYAKVESNTVIGDENRIGHNAEIEGVTMRGISAIHYSEMYGVIGQYVDVAAACVCGILRFNDTSKTHRINGRSYSDKYANAVFIGDYTRTGVNNVFFPGVKVGSECALYPGLNIEKDVSHETLLIKKEEHIEKEWGNKKYGW